METTHETHFQQKPHQSNAMNHRLSILKDFLLLLLLYKNSTIRLFFAKKLSRARTQIF
jgi:hypothetical protein